MGEESGHSSEVLRWASGKVSNSNWKKRKQSSGETLTSQVATGRLKELKGRRRELKGAGEEGGLKARLAAETQVLIAETHLGFFALFIASRNIPLFSPMLNFLFYILDIGFDIWYS